MASLDLRVPMPAPLSKAIDVAASLDTVAGAVRAMHERRHQLPHETEAERYVAATLIGIAMVPDGRAALNAAMDDMWAKNRKLASTGYEEVVIGSGYHAAIYCLNRVRKGLPAPIVFERDLIVGGIFACSKKASFYVNSRNRPGPANAPGELQGLNVISGALIQPSMLSANQYQRNSDLAFAIRLALAMSGAKVFPGVDVGRVGYRRTRGRRGLELLVQRPRRPEAGLQAIPAARVIDARGLGSGAKSVMSPYVLTFTELMQRMDESFPLQGLKRVAVIGGGDSGKCAVEALFGLSPSEHMSIPDLDRPERCDWYCGTAPYPDALGCETWQEKATQRYKRIGSLLPRKNGRGSPLRIKIERGVVVPLVDGAMVNGRRYDLVVECAGWLRPNLGGNQQGEYVLNRGEPVARQAQAFGTFAIGPAADLGFSDFERAQPWAQIGDNVNSMWRLGDRTAAFARLVNNQ